MGKFNEARETVKSMENSLDKMESAIRNIESTSGSTVLSIAVSSMIVISQCLLVMREGARITSQGANQWNETNAAKTANDAALIFGALTPEEYTSYAKGIDKSYKSAKARINTGRAITFIGGSSVALAGIVRRLKGILKEYKASKGTNSKDYFNTYKNQLRKEIRNMKKQVSNLSKAVDASEKKAGKSK